MIEFVYLDAGGTLIDPFPSVGGVYARAGKAHGLEANSLDLQRGFAQVWSEARGAQSARFTTFGRDEPETHAFWRSLVFDVLDVVGFDGDKEACFLAFFRAFEEPEAWTVYPDVQPLLAGLKRRGIKAGLLSNWDYRLPPLLQRLGIQDLQPQIISCFEGIAKPDPELYRRAAQRVGIAPERIVYVGDHRDLDLDPALEVGFEAYLIDREGKEEHDPRAIKSLTALLDLLTPDGRK